MKWEQNYRIMDRKTCVYGGVWQCKIAMGVTRMVGMTHVNGGTRNRKESER